MGLGKSKDETVAKELFEEVVGPAPKFDADEGTVEKALRKNPPEKTAPKASAWEPDS